MSGKVMVPWWLSKRLGVPATPPTCETSTCPGNAGVSARVLASLGVSDRRGGSIDRRLSCEGENSDAVESRRLVTDGGSPAETDDSGTDRHQQLQQLFEDVTGAVALVQSQDSSVENRCLDEHETDISRYVTDAAKSDGLSDAIATPDASDGGSKR